MEKNSKSRPEAIAAPVKSTLRLASGLAVLSNLAGLGQAIMIAAALGGMLVPPMVWLPWQIALGYLGFSALRIGLGYLAEGRAFAAADRLIRLLRQEIIDTEARTVPRPGGGGVGATAALAVEKLDMLQPWLTRFGPAKTRAMVVPLVILAIAFWYSWAIGLVFLLTGPLIPVAMAFVGVAAQRRSRSQLAKVASLNDALMDRLTALLDIRVLDAGPHVVADFAQGAGRLKQRTMAVLKVAFLSSTLLELLAAMGIALVAIYAGLALIGQVSWGSYGTAISPQVMVFLLLLAPEFYQPLRDMSAAWHDRASGAAVAADIDAWRATARDPIMGAGQAEVTGPTTLALSGLVLRRGERRIAYPDFTLEPGQSVAILGPSGAGKSSLLLAVAGLIAPESGEITCSGQPLTDATAQAWRARLGWMPQRLHFMDETLRQTVGQSADAQIDHALTRAGVAEVVAALPDQDQTVLGELGGGLSGGEARRVTLARAIYGKPDLLLADEPTADLDAETAALVTEGLLRLQAEGASLLIATHDAELAARLDRIIEVDQL